MNSRIKKVLPDTEKRVEENTAESVNQEIIEQIVTRLEHYSRRIDEIDKRLRKLDSEWDIERTLELNAACVSLFGLFMSMTNRKWRILPVIVAGFLAQHAVQGWCPPIPILRRLGVRTTREINEERYALKALRGDFDAVGQNHEDPIGRAASALRAAEH